MSEKLVFVDWQEIQPYIAEIFIHTNIPKEDAEWLSKSLVDTTLWGIDSHGILRVPKYVDRFVSGAVNRNPHVRYLKGSNALEVMDGDRGSGAVVGRHAMERAIELAKEYNVGVVGAINSNHFGAAMFFARMAAAENMIGIAMTNVVPNIVAPGAMKPVVGNNPIAVAAPTYGDFPVVLDISLSNVAGGKLLLAKKKGEKIPLNWATDNKGRPTDDPDIGFKGFLLPLGGHKGFGAALIVDILCGLMTGGAFLDKLRGTYTHPDDPSLTCHLMAAINIDSILDRQEMADRMDYLMRTIKAIPVLENHHEVLIPGEPEYRVFQERSENGIPLPQALFDDLKNLGQKLGVTISLQPKTK